MSTDFRSKLQSLPNAPSMKKQWTPNALVESRIVFNKYKGLKSVPTDLSSAGLRVFLLLSECFRIANDVRAAPLHEALWGLSQGGYNPAFLIEGFRNLQENNYIVLTDAACHVLDLSTVNNTGKVWYMLADKWLQLLVPADSLGRGIFPGVHYGTVKPTEDPEIRI